jgi:hypothetical protein
MSVMAEGKKAKISERKLRRKTKFNPFNIEAKSYLIHLIKKPNLIVLILENVSLCREAVAPCRRAGIEGVALGK